MGSMLLELAAYLNSNNGTPSVLFLKSLVPEALSALPHVRLVVAPTTELASEVAKIRGDVRCVVINWMHDPGSSALEETLAVSCRDARVAVFLCSGDDIPESLVFRLGERGIAKSIYVAFGRWHVFRYRRSLGTHLYRARHALHRVVHGLRVRAALLRARLQRAWIRRLAQVRKLVLKRYAVDLHQYWDRPYRGAGGLAFNAHVPALKDHFDTVGVTRDHYALFEEEVCLTAHCGHSDIQDLGSGRCALWEGDIYFSSSDGSDPNINGRRYRLLPLFGRHFWLRPLVALTRPVDRRTRPVDRTSEILDARPLEGVFRVVETATPAPPPALSPDECPLGNQGRLLPEQQPKDLENFWEDPEAINRDRGLLHSGFVTGKVVHSIGSLAPGGSERQLCYLLVEMAARGMDVSVQIPSPPHENRDFDLHYEHTLKAAGVPVHILDCTSVAPRKGTLDGDAIEALWLLDMLPDHMKAPVTAVYNFLIRERPQTFHCWLDHSNIIGGVAAILAGVPQIILSFRSLNTTHFPRLHCEWFQDWYKRIAQCTRVEMIANSRAGGESYADWIGVPHSRVRVIHNGIDPEVFKIPTASEVSDLRARLGVPSNCSLIAGVFRFTSEKRPLRFVRIVSEVLHRVPDLYVVMAGEGPLLSQFRREVHNLGLADRVKILGRTRDVRSVIVASDILLLTSSMEGFPNVLTEAGWLGCPVVAPRVGGIPEVVKDGETGILFKSDSVQEAVDGCVRLLTDRIDRERQSRAAMNHVSTQFTLARFVDQTVDCYVGASPSRGALKRLVGA
jgi:glycosyltransferase involved in cell wall biosynthesis